MAEDTRKRPDFSDHSSNPAPASDPLAELARLIGQSDPFNDVGKRAARKSLDGMKNEDRPAPEWLARPAAPSEPEYDEPHVPQSYRAADYDEPAHQTPADYRPHVAPGFTDDAHYAQGDHYPSEHAGDYQQAHDDYQPDDRYRVAPPSGQYDGDAYYAEDGHLPPQGDEGIVTGRSRSGILTIAAVLGLAVIGTAGAFAYRAYTSGSGSSSTPPIIKADPTPAKTVPAAPAAAASADGKPFQDRIGAQASAERVVPREEQPVSLPIAPAAPRVTAPQPSAQAAAPLVSPPPPTSVNEPKRVKTIPIRQDNIADTGTISGPPPSASAKAPATKQSSSGPMAIAPQSEPTAPAARSKVATRTPAPARGGSYMVQLSAQKTEAEAQSSYRALQSKYPSVLAGREPVISRAELGQAGTWYRVQVGSFATSEQATALCENLKSAGGQCIVQKN
ncbi:MAG: SPOR domain-containing protein [Alphaproteobacteria bacterium]|nr:MAG: SPOR domain-containing protein [Alphaproteobacteria bacterium]